MNTCTKAYAYSIRYKYTHIMEEIRSKLQGPTENLLNDLIYTVLFDYTNEIIESGVDETEALKVANVLVEKYIEHGIKMRKKPASRAKPKTKNDAVSAASRKMKKSIANDIVWIVHPSDNTYLYSTSHQLSSGYPIKNSENNLIVGVIDDTSSHLLTMDDVKIAVSLGMQVDYNSVDDSKA